MDDNVANFEVQGCLLSSEADPFAVGIEELLNQMI
jgi:hypothetical protein